MKNVRGEEIYTTTEEKLAYYDAQIPELVVPGPKEFFLGKTAVKDDYFNDVLMPFCLKNNVQSVLDVGAGYGRYSSKFFNNKILDILAIEITQTRMLHLRKVLDMYGYNKINTTCMDIELCKLSRNYDLIFLSDVVEHLVDYLMVWKECVTHSKFMYALIPKEDSWSWSDDHLWRFTDNEIMGLIGASAGVVNCDVIDFDDKNSWYALIVRGSLWNQ